MCQRMRQSCIRSHSTLLAHACRPTIWRVSTCCIPCATNCSRRRWQQVLSTAGTAANARRHSQTASIVRPQVSCTKGRRLSGWLRLAIVVGVPFLLAVFVILVPLTCLRCRDRRRMRKLHQELGSAQSEILEYRNALTVQMMRDTVSGAVARPATALRNLAARGGSSRHNRVHPAPPSGARGSRPAAAAAPEGSRRVNRAAASQGGRGKRTAAQENGCKLMSVNENGPSCGRPRGAADMPKPRVLPKQVALNGYTGPAWPVASGAAGSGGAAVTRNAATKPKLPAG